MFLQEHSVGFSSLFHGVVSGRDLQIGEMFLQEHVENPPSPNG